MARSQILGCCAVGCSVLTYGASALAVDCFIDSVNGNDSNSGLSEDQALKSQASIPSTCTAAKFKRGSQFNEAVKVGQQITTYTNYGELCAPLPRFVVQRVDNSGSIFRGFGSGITIDGLYMAGSKSDAEMTNLINGVCVFLGSNSQLLNSEITNCDIGIMLSGTGNLVRNNYIHDLYISVDAAQGVDPNAVGGAEGIFINGSDNEVAYNDFIRCSSAAEWTGGSCDGGATEVTVGSGSTLSGVRVHHNFSYKSCGFFEISSGFGGTGTFADSEFYNNVSIDSGWLMLLQVNNTVLSNIRWENNTIVHRQAEAVNPGMLVTVFTGTSSGQTGGSLAPSSVFLSNSLFVMDGFGQMDYISPLDENLEQASNLIVRSPGENAGLVNVAGATPADFDLAAGSPAIDGGVATVRALDFLNRSAPSGSAMDIGAFEYGASLAAGQSTPVSAQVATAGCTTTGGSPATGGSDGEPTGSGGMQTSTGGADGGVQPGLNDASGVGGATTSTAPSDGTEESGCSCRLAGAPRGASTTGWLTLLALGWGLGRDRKNARRRRWFTATES